MKKSILIIAALVIGTGISFSQGGKLKKANNAFAQFSYSKAIEKYEKLELDDLESKRNLAISYWKLNQLAEAETLYSKIVKEEGHVTKDYYDYASILREAEKYDLAEEWMTKFAEMNAQDSRGKEHLGNLGAFEKLQKDKGQFLIQNLDINSEQQDFGTSYYQDKVIFASSREGKKSVIRRWNRNQLPFLDMYVAEMDGQQLVSANLFSKKVNKKFHEGPVAFNQAGDLMIFTRNNYEEKSSDKLTRLKLFISKKEGNVWTKPLSLPFNSPDYSVGHASISADGKMLYFASDMPGGFGGVDIYRAVINEDGSFGPAINLGEEVNSEGNEMFPYIHTSNEMLFFSSNGKLGLGGLDVFVAKINTEDEIGKVLNVGVPINSNKDDFSFVLNENQTAGYLSSNREGGKGDDDIYSVFVKAPFGFGKRMYGNFVDEDGRVVEGFKFKILNTMNEVVLEGISSANERFVLDMGEDEKYTIKGAKEGFFDASFDIDDTENEDRDFEINFEVTRNPGLSLYTYIYDNRTQKPIADAEIRITDKETGAVKTFLTSTNGDNLYPLMDKKIMDEGKYAIRIIKSGYLTVSGEVDLLFDKEGRYNISEYMDIKMEAIQVGGDLSKIIEINPIYFDLNKYNIREDASIELDKIVKIMNENPEMVIELGSHTDSRGSDASNRALSDKRAKASAAYIAKQITNPERISGKGYGESTPNIVDAREEGGTAQQLLTESFINSFRSKNKKIFDKLHQYNRRTEFIILKI